MLQIIDLAFQEIQVRGGEGLRISDLMAGEPNQPALCVHDFASELSLMVDPKRIAVLAQTLSVDFSSLLAGSPIVPYLAYGQIAVHREMPAHVVISLAEWQNLGYIVVEADSHYPVGVVGVAHIRSALENAHAVRDARLSNSVATALERGGLSEAIFQLDNYFDPGQFHSESINSTPHPAPQCAGDGGHYVGRCPCRTHSGANCR